MNNKYIISILIGVLVLIGCKDEVLPKPKAMLRLDYARTTSTQLETNNFSFAYNEAAKVRSKNNTSMILEYPEMKAAIFITHKKVTDNLEKLMYDAKRLSYEHGVKADNIAEQPFVNDENRVYGMYYEVIGNAASQAQFYATDSTGHFVTGALYFKAKPNYDSIYPAAAYLQNDIRYILETLRWK